MKVKKSVRLGLTALLLGTTVLGYAEDCTSYTSQSESEFTQQAANDPQGVQQALEQCIQQNSCASVSDPNEQAQCTKNLIYYNAIATYFAHGGAQSGQGPSNYSNSYLPQIPVAPQQSSSAAPPSNDGYSSSAQPPAENAADTVPPSPTNGPSDSNNKKNIYNDINF